MRKWMRFLSFLVLVSILNCELVHSFAYAQATGAESLRQRDESLMELFMEAARLEQIEWVYTTRLNSEVSPKANPAPKAVKWFDELRERYQKPWNRLTFSLLGLSGGSFVSMGLTRDQTALGVFVLLFLGFAAAGMKTYLEGQSRAINRIGKIGAEQSEISSFWRQTMLLHPKLILKVFKGEFLDAHYVKSWEDYVNEVSAVKQYTASVRLRIRADTALAAYLSDMELQLEGLSKKSGDSVVLSQSTSRSEALSSLTEARRVWLGPLRQRVEEELGEPIDLVPVLLPLQAQAEELSLTVNEYLEGIKKRRSNVAARIEALLEVEQMEKNIAEHLVKLDAISQGERERQKAILKGKGWRLFGFDPKDSVSKVAVNQLGTKTLELEHWDVLAELTAKGSSVHLRIGSPTTVLEPGVSQRALIRVPVFVDVLGDRAAELGFESTSFILETRVRFRNWSVIGLDRSDLIHDKVWVDDLAPALVNHLDSILLAPMVRAMGGALEARECQLHLDAGA